LAQRGRHRLVEQGQVVARDVHELVLGVATLAGEVEDPASDRIGLATGAGAADDDGDLDHDWGSPCWNVPDRRRMVVAQAATRAGLAAIAGLCGSSVRACSMGAKAAR